MLQFVDLVWTISSKFLVDPEKDYDVFSKRRGRYIWLIHHKLKKYEVK